VFQILGRYNNQTEEIDTADTKQEAEYLLGEYQLAFGAGWRLWIKKEAKQCSA